VNRKIKLSKKKKWIIITAMAVTAIAVLSLVAISAYYNHRQYVETKAYISDATLKIENGTKKVAVTADIVIAYYTLINRAEHQISISHYDTAITIFEEAKTVAAAIYYDEGVSVAESSIKETQERIITAKRNVAIDLLLQGDELINEEKYNESLEPFLIALEIFHEITNEYYIAVTEDKIEYVKFLIYESEKTDEQPPEDTQDGTDIDPPDSEITDITLNYEHNISIYFDLVTPIDYQRQRPASDIRMGANEGYNEGWYNGCGWIAVYNALIILENPVHPAEIVKDFETNVGIVLGGVFGTYPNTIVNYLRNMGYDVNNTLFPQLSLNIDEVIKASKVSILAYAHTSAAHYITIEYREDIDKFIVYNDSFARTRSKNLGFQNDTNTGAVIDSVAALINSTSNILFSFSLIVVS